MVLHILSKFDAIFYDWHKIYFSFLKTSMGYIRIWSSDIDIEVLTEGCCKIVVLHTFSMQLPWNIGMIVIN